MSELIKQNVFLNKKTSLADSFCRITTPQNLGNSLHSDSFSNNEVTITESGNSVESTTDNNIPSTHAEIHAPLTTNDHLSSLTKDSDEAFMNMEAKFSALKVYIDCGISSLNSKFELLIESLKETITKMEKSENNNMGVLQENTRFLQKELLAKNDIIKPLTETQTVNKP